MKSFQAELFKSEFAKLKKRPWINLTFKEVEYGGGEAIEINMLITTNLHLNAGRIVPLRDLEKARLQGYPVQMLAQLHFREMMHKLKSMCVDEIMGKEA